MWRGGFDYDGGVVRGGNSSDLFEKARPYLTGGMERVYFAIARARFRVFFG